MLRSIARQRGQALLIVLAFLAAFTVILWAAAFYASGSFAVQRGVAADSRATYAVDAAMQWGLAYIRLNALTCTSGTVSPAIPSPGPAVNGYPATVSITPDPSCTTNTRVFNLTASAGSRQGQAQVVASTPMTLNWYVLQ